MSAVQRTISVSNATENLSKVREFVTEVMREGNVNREDENRVILAVDEAVSNIIEHAFEHSLKTTIRIEVDVDDKRCQVVILDSGAQFDPLSITPPDLEEHIRAGKQRGLGIFLMRQVMDEVQYHYKAGEENVLTLVKYLS